MKAAQPTVQIRNATEELQSVSMIFNRRLEFEVNRDLERVVVKVIDRETDKVIKELPPEEIQRLHVRIREAIGLLVDEEI
jgi:flagellar protein FlaG